MKSVVRAVSSIPARSIGAALCISALLILAGCPKNPPGNADPNLDNGPKLHPVTLNDPVKFQPLPGPIRLDAAKNEWTSYIVQLDDLPAPDPKEPLALRLPDLKLPADAGTIPSTNFIAYQIASLPIDLNRAGYVRHTGLLADTRRVPRALLPMPITNGQIDLSTLRRPEGSDNSFLLWIDVHIPPESLAGKYAATCELLAGQKSRILRSLPVQLDVSDFVIPDERHLQMVSRLDWESLVRLYPDRFEAIRPQLINRSDDRYAATVKTLDQIVSLAQAHRTQVVIPKLQPTVKWPAGQAPQIDWRDFDPLVSPWLRGESFADRTPLAYWPLPAVDFLDRFDRNSQLDYWAAAASHFDQLGWLKLTAVFLEKPTPGRAGSFESAQISALANQILACHPRLRVAIPLEEEQIQLADDKSKLGIDRNSTGRLLAASPGLVFSTPSQPWPSGITRPQRWLRTDLPGLVPYAGAGSDERDVRLWAWLAFLRQSPLILFNDPFPQGTAPTQIADPSELVWFYPGSWFGLDEPVPSIQLKWLRRAQQDFEYLWLAKQRGEVINALVMARLITKPVEIQAHQQPDPTYALMSGTTNQQAWDDIQRLLARTILLRQPGLAADPTQRSELNLNTLQWIEPQERPLLIGRSAAWNWDKSPDHPGQSIVTAQVGVDIYNASDNRPDQNQLRWSAVPPAWQIKPQPIDIPALATYRVQRFAMNARVNLDQLSPATRQPIEFTFVNGFTSKTQPIHMMLPVALSERREGRLALDGSLNEWSEADSIHSGPLVRMLNRPALQRQEIQLATTDSSIYTGWAEDNFYLAFKLSGLAATDGRSSRNFVDYQFRRAWSEDLAEVLIQGVYPDNSTGPVLHLVCKPNGHWVELKADARTNADPWQPLEGAGIRYAATLDGKDWRGEVAIPWKAIIDQRGRPSLLRFNFIQHQTATGDSASWAGPLDFGRDDSLMGLLYLKDSPPPGLREPGK